MCGRFVGYRNLDELKEVFPIDRSACEVTANYNAAPSQEILAIYNHQEQNWLDKFHWGLVPFWAKDPTIGNRMINARAETVTEKPSFKNAFKKRRCLIIADGRLCRIMGNLAQKRSAIPLSVMHHHYDRSLRSHA
jgi:putative SOS response-associated peptidase YedK